MQKALGHWDRWLLTRNDRDREEFLRLCRWLLSRQDDYGGWPVWSELALSFASPYSAMTQGECISAFVRAWKLTGEAAFGEGARRALDLMCRPVERGGPAIAEGNQLFLEEAPSIPRSSILNGWIFALFGLYDFWLAFQDENARDLFRLSLDTLKGHLHEYDAGYWSYYDIRGHLASPFYHDLHIHQLTALAMIDDDTLIPEFRDRWMRYQQVWRNRVRAIGVKVLQKLREPEEAVIIR
ncbi:MAG: D-glucuronyl C5-epimerase family protein [Anaerolineae bacterium]